MKKFLVAITLALIFTVTAAEPKNITVDEAANLIAKDTNVVVLDVRSPEEFKSGHIKGATNINFHDKDFAEKIAKLDKNKTYIVHCAAGGRSSSACEKIKPMDFKNVLHMKQGFSTWEGSGKPVEK